MKNNHSISVVVYATILGTSLANANGVYKDASNIYPSINIKYPESKTLISWEQSPYSFDLPLRKSNELSPFLEFTENVITSNKDIDLEIQQVVNKIFWELI